MTVYEISNFLNKKLFLVIDDQILQILLSSVSISYKNSKYIKLEIKYYPQVCSAKRYTENQQSYMLKNDNSQLKFLFETKEDALYHLM